MNGMIKYYDKLVILQSNNYFDVEEHVNCPNNIDEFKAQALVKNICLQVH